jgi:hypothetical protein
MMKASKGGAKVLAETKAMGSSRILGETKILGPIDVPIFSGVIKVSSEFAAKEVK